MRKAFGALGAISILLLPAASFAAEMRGVTPTEIRIGQTMPYSGPVSAFGALGKGEAGYFRMLNERGGINGRKINFISLDDSYAPPKTVEQTRRLVESDEVALIFSSIGTAHNTAIAKYLQGKNIPQLFLASGASKFGDIAQFPQATMGVQAPFRYEARLYARYALAKNPNARFAVISQNDDYGRDYLAGLKDVLGEKYDSFVTVATYEISDPTIDSQIVKLKATNADVFVIAATPKFAAQSIRKAFEIGWRPMTFLSNTAVWISTVMQPAGVEAGTGIISTAYVKDPDDPAWKDDPGMKGWRDFMTKYVPEGDQHDTNYVNAYNSAMALEAVLKACGDDLSTENILRQAFAIKDLELPMLLPGIRVNTSPADHVPVDQMQLMRFNGKSWDRFGELQTGN
ncbi:ABC transporter substrate-binding protein [Bradyrhizobium sp. CER78]|uniref:ABC transporter substrate-binding protein n=1 Tax=Bradyrhizobium sp. CER78 TaxID=3039162 RepID=UPI00244A6A83|nr:ABC transporter substrate-binding protein [Bradyrhizobium sp. CER78]MDH2385161.1 ABC transporter substrate-binding protein [Bradyrhizobium sp. CER78]